MKDNYSICPFTVIVDSREQAGFVFRGFTTDADKQNRDLIIPLETAGLPTGDYSIKGYEHRIAIERKSLSDAYSTFTPTGGRERFERELARLQEMEYAAVVIEAGWPTILNSPPEHSGFLPKALFRSVIAWQVRFPRVHWWACDTRFFAEHVTFRLLSRFWSDDQEKQKQAVA